MATMATNHVSVAMAQVVTCLPRYSHFFSNYIIPSHYDQMLFFSVYLLENFKNTTEDDEERLSNSFH